jgi:glycosyltransferase involved in cell wall biosynthesis
MKLRIVHIVAGLWKDTGGPAEVIPNLCRAQVEAGAEVILCSIDGDTAPQVAALEGSGVDVQLFSTLDSTLRYSPAMARFLKSLGTVDVIHNHGHWLWPNWYAFVAARRLNARLVTTPHGTLVPGMLEHSSLKKGIAWALLDRHLIARADIIHALSPAEHDAMAAKLGPHAHKMQVVPNGVNLGQDTGQNTAESGGVLLFLSRVSPIKGVTQLLTAWQTLAPKFPEWSLRIVGPLDPEIVDEVTSLSKSADRVELAGPIYADQRWAEYRTAAAFVLPTLGEGLPTVLLEASAHGLPVITTPEANFKELFEAGGSLLTAPDAGALEITLSEFFNRSGEDRRAIGLRGLALMKAHYTWDAIAEQWLSIYARTQFEQSGN